MEMTVAVLQAISTGTFVYCLFIEVFPGELKLGKGREIEQLILLLIGFGAMAGLQTLDALTEE